MVDEALTFGDLNVIVVDWVGGIHKNNKLSALVINKKIYNDRIWTSIYTGCS